MTNSPKDTEQRESYDSLFVDDIDFVADGGNGETGACGQNSGLRDHAVSGQGVHDRLGPRLGVLLRNAGLKARGGQGSCESSDGKRRANSGRTYTSQLTCL